MIESILLGSSNILHDVHWTHEKLLVRWVVRFEKAELILDGREKKEEADFTEPSEDGANLPSRELVDTAPWQSKTSSLLAEEVEEADIAEWIEVFDRDRCRRFDSAAPRNLWAGVSTAEASVGLDHRVPPDSQMQPDASGRLSGPRPPQRVDGSTSLVSSLLTCALLICFGFCASTPWCSSGQLCVACDWSASAGSALHPSSSSTGGDVAGASALGQSVSSFRCSIQGSCPSPFPKSTRLAPKKVTGVESTPGPQCGSVGRNDSGVLAAEALAESGEVFCAQSSAAMVSRE